MAASREGRGASAPEADEPVWRTLQRCPANTLYVTLRLYGKEVSYQEIEGALPIGREGGSLADMRKLAARHGLPAQVRKLTPEQLAQVRFPAIAHLEDAEGPAGHFIVLLELGKLNTNGTPMIEYIDGTTGMTALMDWGEFRKRWTGFVLTFEPETAGWGWRLPTAVFLGALLVALTLVRLRLGRDRTGRKGNRVPAQVPLT
jgi:ABC-type bacteriocin/lantibiotic exporter with double-glycine peptidase domain